MQIKYQLLDYTERGDNRVNVFTANSVVVSSKEGPRLIMGGGAALAAHQAYVRADLLLGEAIQKNRDEHGDFGYIDIVDSLGDRLGAYQAKRHYANPSTIELIISASVKFAEVANKFPEKEFHTNCPGIGLGGLSEEEVLPVIFPLLPNNVIVYI